MEGGDFYSWYGGGTLPIIVIKLSRNLWEASLGFLEISQVKEQIVKLEEDKDIINSYLGKFYSVSVLPQQDKQYKDKLINYLSCLKQEIKQNTEKLCKLQIRNLIYNEMLIILDKLSYITSTNQKVKEELTG